MSTAPLNLSTIVFTPGDDEVIVDDTITVDSAGLFEAIRSDLFPFVDTLDGDDLIHGSLSGTVDDTPPIFGTPFMTGIFLDDDLLTGEGRDDVIGETDFTRNSTSVLFVSGITGEGGLIDTGDDNDLVRGIAMGTGKRVEAVGIDNIDIDTGEGRDTVEAMATAIATSGASQFEATGIRNVNDLNTGDGNDTVLAEASLDLRSGNEGTAVGIFDSTINTGSGRDNVTGATTANGAGTASILSTAGIRSTSFSTGDGNDQVTGTADATLGNGGSASDLFGIFSGDGEFGSGRDSVKGIATSTGVNNSVHDGIVGISGFDFATADGDDDVLGSAIVTSGKSSTTNDVKGINSADVSTGNAQDTIEGLATVSVGNNSIVGETVGISNATIDTGENADIIMAHAVVEAGSGSAVTEVIGIDGSMIITGDGDDLIDASASISGTGSGPTTAFGSGIILTDIDTGAGDDEIIAIGADVADGGDSFGIDNIVIGARLIELGAGEDSVTARGATAGVADVHIFGDEGDDIFDLHSGTGLINGGDDIDLLILAGDSIDFTFTSNGVNTITDGGVTDLEVANIEQFQFDDGLFDFGDLF